MSSAVVQVLNEVLKLEAARATRREKARVLIENNDIDGIAALILASEQRDAAKKGESRAIRYALKLKRFIATKNLTSEMVTFVEGK